MTCVRWGDAKAYVYWLSMKTGQNYRLLTEAEWEYAARAGTTTAYHFGQMLSDGQANYGNEGTVPTDSFPENAFGLHDMYGNAWEWVEDCWHDDYTGAPINGSVWLSGCRSKNKSFKGIAGRNIRVLRGGSWYSKPQNLRSADRGGSDATLRDINVGFRVARTLTP